MKTTMHATACTEPILGPDRNEWRHRQVVPNPVMSLLELEVG